MLFDLPQSHQTTFHHIILPPTQLLSIHFQHVLLERSQLEYLAYLGCCRHIEELVVQLPAHVPEYLTKI